MSENSQKPLIAILVSVIAAVGASGTALFTNWSNIFPNKPTSTDQVANSPAKSQAELLDVKFNVYTKDNNPIESVEVQFISNGAPSPRYTDSNGYVTIEIPKRKDVEIVLRKNKFQTKRQILDLQTDLNRTFTVYLDRLTETEVNDKPRPTVSTSSREKQENKDVTSIASSNKKYSQPTIHKGYCTLIADSRSNNLVNDPCSIYEYENGAYKLSWSTGKSSSITSNPNATLDDIPASILDSGPTNMTIKSTQGKIGFCWNCTP